MKSAGTPTKMSDRNPFLSVPEAGGNAITIHSRLKSWYYVSVKGYRVLRESATPEPGLFGGISYRRTWILDKPAE